MSNNNVNIRVVQHQSEEVNETNPLSEEEKMAFLAKYYPEEFEKQVQQERKKRCPKPHQKRVSGDEDTQKSNQEYYDIRYRDLDVGDDKVNFKIEVKSDMKF